jgi:ATP-binding cassette, subfamily F, member 3
MTPGEARGYLARFLFRGDDAFKEVRSSSRAASGRVSSSRSSAFCRRTCSCSTSRRTTWTSPPARRSRRFIADTGATLLVVSHDRRLLETICDRLWVVDGGLAVPFEGGYRAWRTAVADGWTVAAEAERQARRLRPGVRRTAGQETGEARVKATAGGGAGRVGRSDSAGKPDGGAANVAAPVAPPAVPRTARPKLSKEAYRRRREALDGELSRLGTRKGQLELQLGMPSVAANFVELRRVTSELADVEAALAAAEDAWLELEEQAP